MKRQHRIALAAAAGLLIVSTAALLFPLLKSGFFVSDDGSWMIIRLSAFFQSMREGQFPVRFLGRLNYSYGYPVANFLYPGFLYIGSLIHLAGFSFVDTVKILLGGSVLTGALFTYLWLKTYFDRTASAIGVFGFILAPYLVFDLYSRGSVGEVLAIAWAAMGLYSIAAVKPWLLALSVSLLIVSHNTLAFLFIGLFLIYITVRGRWKDFWLTVLLGIGMVSFFWVPALHERKYVVFDSVDVSSPSQYFITVKNWLLLGISGIAAAAGSLLTPVSHKKERNVFIVLLILTIGIALPISNVLWNIPVFSHIIQFPYRILSLTVFLDAWLMAYVFSHSKNGMRVGLTVFFAGAGLWTLVPSLQSIRYMNVPEGYYTTNEATTTVQDEYMPVWVTDKPTQRAYDKLIFYEGAGTFDVKTLTSQSVDVVVHAAGDSVIQMNTIYYPGWGVTVDNAPVTIDYKNNRGVMRVSVPQGTHHLVAGFRETISRFIADAASLGFFIWYLIVLVMKKRRV